MGRHAARQAVTVRRRWALPVAALLAAWTAIGAVAAAEDRIVITTGATDGVYYATGRAICEALARQAPTLKCSVVPSNGSAENVMRLRNGAAQFAIVQSDVQFDAVAGRGLFATTGAEKSLRAVLSLHEEALAVMVRRDDKARMVSDLRGRSFSAGNFGSGTRETAEHLLDAAGWTADDKKNLRELPVDTQFRDLCAGKVDAVAYLVGHPARNIMVAAEQCDLRLLPVQTVETASITRRHPAHARTTIPGGLYRGNDTATPAIAVYATLVTLAATPDKTVEALVKATVRDLQVLKDIVEALSGVTAVRMGSVGLSAPLHAGAKTALGQLAIPANPAVKVTAPSAKPGAASTAKPPPVLDLSGPGQTAAGGAAATTGSATAAKPNAQSKQVGASGQWTVDRGGQATGAPALGADGAFEDAETSIQFKRALKK